MKPQTKSEISPSRRQLVEIMQQLNYGRLEQLSVSAGEPVFTPPPRIIRDIKLGSDSSPRPEASLQDFVLRTQVTELFAHLDDLGTGEIELLEIRGGLPFRVQVRQ